MKKYTLVLNKEDIENIEEIYKKLTFESDYIYANKLEKIILDKIKELKEKEYEKEDCPIKEYK